MSELFEEITTKLNIKNITRDTKCWIVRCEKNFRYYEHFKGHGIAAIGHIDALGYKQIDKFLEDIENATASLTTIIQENDPDKDESTAKRIARKYINQTLMFINDIKENDYVITIGEDKILVGYASKYYELSTEELVIEDTNLKGEHYNVNMNLSLRRDVEWTYEIDKEKLPPSLYKAILSQQTVYNYKDINSLLHMIYPMYLFEKQVFHFSININQERDLNNYQITKMFMFLNQFEFIVKSIDSINIDNYDALLEEFDEYSLNVKAKFMSEGNTWATLLLDRKHLVSAIVFYTMIFGNNALGVDGIIDKELKHKIYDQYFSHDAEKVIQKKVIENQDTQRMIDLLKITKPEQYIA